MTLIPVGRAARRRSRALGLLACCALLIPALVAGTAGSARATASTASAATDAGATASDDFSRADGPLGASWTDSSSGGLAISSGDVAGTAAGGLTGDAWNADTFSADQFSQIQLTSAPLTGGEWIGAAARVSDGGQDGYVGLYFWNDGSPEVMLFAENGGSWAQLGATYASGTLAAGTQLAVTVTGSAVSVQVNGTAQISATDTSVTGGAPGIMAYGTGSAGPWTGGDASPASGGFTVGGTVAGLSGTVVLADNGGDPLTVGADGSFTFDTSLADGGAYDVTVATYPAGQACTVSGGAGTIDAASVTSVAVTCVTGTSQATATDNFSRPDGPLGPDWTDFGSGGLAISADAATGTQGTGITGDYWTADTFSSDQTAQVALGSAALSGTQWIGAAARVQDGGADAYAGIYYWNNGSPELMLFAENGGSWAQLGGTVASGTLPAGTTLEVLAAGSSVALLENGTPQISATDTSLSGGAPGIISYGTGFVSGWAGGDAPAGSGDSGASGSGGVTGGSGGESGSGSGAAGGTGSAGPLFTVGGSAAGLTGALGLADNGNDALTVSESGTFTFETALPAGATYNVTIVTEPPGQTCSVLGGGGTVSGAVTSVSVSCAASSAGSGAADDFNRANGPLGPDWTATSDGGLVIAADAVTGAAGTVSGDIRTAESYSGNQFSQIQVTGAQLTGTQWVGAAVRVQDSGQDAYVGIYSWNNGSPELELFLRSSGSWDQLGSSYASGPLAAGTQLRVEAVGSTIALLCNGVQRIAVGDTTLSGGAPGIMTNGAAQADNWSGGTAGFGVNYLSTDSSGIASYDIISANDSDGPQVLRVLQPSSPAPGVAHNFLFVLPVEPGLGSSYGDGLETLQSLDAQDQYNLTIVEPSFATDPWYADNAVNPNIQYQTFLTTELVPWVESNLATSGSEQNWLIGFSKSGIGGQDLILKFPGLFTLAASWDFPADMASYDQFGADSEAGYGTNANFQANYELTQSFVDARKGPFLSSNRIWIGGYGLYQTDDADYDQLLTAEGIEHATETPTSMAHRWDSGWVPLALAALYKDSLQQ